MGKSKNNKQHNDDKPKFKVVDFFTNLKDDVYLGDMALIGTHNSTTFHQIKTNPIDPNYFEGPYKLSKRMRLLGGLTRRIFKNWSVTQFVSLEDQLEMGTRYLDIRLSFVNLRVKSNREPFYTVDVNQVLEKVRQSKLPPKKLNESGKVDEMLVPVESVEKEKEPKLESKQSTTPCTPYQFASDGVYETSHGLINGVTLFQIITTVKRFLLTHPNEIVILDMNHVRGVTDFERFRQDIYNMVGSTDLIIPAEDVIKKTVNEILQTTGRIVLHVDYEYEGKKMEPCKYIGGYLDTMWANEDKVANWEKCVEQFYAKDNDEGYFAWKKTHPHSIYIIQDILTPKGKSFGRFSSLEVFARNANDQMHPFTEKIFRADKSIGGVILCDFMDGDECEFCKQINVDRGYYNSSGKNLKIDDPEEVILEDVAGDLTPVHKRSSLVKVLPQEPELTTDEQQQQQDVEQHPINDLQK